MSQEPSRKKRVEKKLPSAADGSSKPKRDEGPLDLATKSSLGRTFSVVKVRFQ